MSTLDGLLSAHARPAAPLLTHYDLATGERVELSAITVANWVAKTANLCVDEYDAEPGTRVRVGLPTHWQRFVWVLATWAFGGVVTDRHADIGVSGPDLRGDEPVRLAASLRPLGGRFTSAPDGFTDLGVVVPAQPDIFSPFNPVTDDLVAVELDGSPRTHRAVLDACSANAGRRLITPGSLDRDVALLVETLRGAGSLVIVAQGTDDDLARIADQEHAEPIS